MSMCGGGERGRTHRHVVRGRRDLPEVRHITPFIDDHSQLALRPTIECNCTECSSERRLGGARARVTHH